MVAQMPFHGGMLSVHQVPLPTSKEEPVKAKLEVHRVPLGSLLAALTGNKASATGVVSGVLPVTISPDGSIRLQKGLLGAEGQGKIRMLPEAIPGDNEQVAVVRQIMKNLNYSVLKVAMDTDDKGKLSVKLSIVGSNPDMYEGRTVNLNVNLSGDVLELIQQSLLTIDPQKLIEQGSHD
ncbi:MAG: hypothetical protein EBR02_07280 [Alphaproteobacteria bacterium]|nr:hypothetical protein [Alphaproteobacteria bacterium]